MVLGQLFTSFALSWLRPARLVRCGFSLLSWGLAGALAVAETPEAVNPSATSPQAASLSADVVVYGGTSGGIAAAIQTRRLGQTVILVEPSQRLGGLTTGGLGQTDIGNKAAIGGIALEFYKRIAKHYANPDAWKWQTRDSYRSHGQSRTEDGETAMWTFEPSVAVQIYDEMIRETGGITILLGERLNRETGVQKDGRNIVQITMESGKVLQGKMFIDATYEGDLLAAAGISYTVGREANATYGETLNGVQTRNAVKHQLQPGIDPYFHQNSDAATKTAIVLPGIDPEGPGVEGAGDHRVQAYCFRMCLTDHPENRIPFQKPAGYEEGEYELLFRNYEAGFQGIPWKNDPMPNRKTDTNNNTGFSTDYIGQNYAYPEASYAAREPIVARHRRYQQGLMWTLANHPRIPETVRREMSRWGVCKDEFVEGNGWQEQLYIREARRMVSEYVMTQHHCQGREMAADAVGLAAYGMDSHNVQRYIDANRQVRNEGDVQVGGFAPYPISYRAVVPKATECTNLLVPVCLSASHIAFGSIRMEPVFMVLGQSTATAACLAINAGVAVQDLNYTKLQEQLLADKQILTWTGPRRTQSASGLAPEKLGGIVLDEDSASNRQGFATVSASVAPYVGIGYRHDNNEQKGTQSIRFVPKFSKSGIYEVRLYYSANSNRATNVPVTVHTAQGMFQFTINQRQKPADNQPYVKLGSFEFLATTDKEVAQSVTIRNDNTDGFVIVDAVQFIPTSTP